MPSVHEQSDVPVTVTLDVPGWVALLTSLDAYCTNPTAEPDLTVLVESLNEDAGVSDIATPLHEILAATTFQVVDPLMRKYGETVGSITWPARDWLLIYRAVTMELQDWSDDVREGYDLVANALINAVEDAGCNELVEFFFSVLGRGWLQQRTT